MKNKILFHVIIIIIIAIPVAFLFYGWASLNYESQPDYKYTEVTRTEPRVGEQIRDSDESIILNEIEKALYRKREKKKGYHHIRNRYHVIVLSVIPVKKDVVRREYCRDYAFYIHKIERPHIGTDPKEFTYEEQKILSKIEKRINKLLRKSQKNTPQKVCKDNLFDAIRYTAPRYGYKRRFLNRERANWELIFLISFGVLALVVALMIWLIGKLF